jgi:glycosyltransferase involved in cell wall biosynthesis
LRNALDVPSAHELARIVKRGDIEIIHAHMGRDYPLAAYAAKRNSDVRLIVTRHVLFPLNRLHGQLLSRASRVIAVSQAVADQLIKQRLVPQEKISIVPNGVDLNRLRESRLTVDRELLHREWGVPERSVLVGSVGQLRPLKGHDVFVRAAAIVAAQVPSAHFVIAGGDDSHQTETHAALTAQIETLNLQKKIHLLGHVNHIAPFLAGLDLFVSSSQTESFGLAIAEAMATGLPVVATSTDGAREIVRDGETGRIVSLGNSDELAEEIIALLKDPHRMSQMGRAAQAYVSESLSMERMVDAVEKIYKESLTG